MGQNTNVWLNTKPKQYSYCYGTIRDFLGFVAIVEPVI